MLESEVVLRLIAARVGMEGHSEELRGMLNLYADALGRDGEAAYLPDSERENIDPTDTEPEKGMGGEPAHQAEGGNVDSVDAEPEEGPEEDPGGNEKEEKIPLPWYASACAMEEESSEAPQEENERAEAPTHERKQQGATPGTEQEYTGFLHIKCSHCGETKTFNARIPMTQFICRECGQVTTLKDMVRAYVNCECGQRSAYLTNETVWGCDINCVRCGSPVALEYVTGKNCYAPIRSLPPKAGKRKKG